MVSLILISVSNLCEPNPFALGVLSGGFVFIAGKSLPRTHHFARTQVIFSSGRDAFNVVWEIGVLTVKRIPVS